MILTEEQCDHLNRAIQIAIGYYQCRVHEALLDEIEAQQKK